MNVSVDQIIAAKLEGLISEDEAKQAVKALLSHCGIDLESKDA